MNNRNELDYLEAKDLVREWMSELRDENVTHIYEDKNGKHHRGLSPKQIALKKVNEIIQYYQEVKKYISYEQ